MKWRSGFFWEIEEGKKSIKRILINSIIHITIVININFNIIHGPKTIRSANMQLSGFMTFCNLLIILVM